MQHLKAGKGGGRQSRAEGWRESIVADRQTLIGASTRDMKLYTGHRLTRARHVGRRALVQEDTGNKITQTWKAEEKRQAFVHSMHVMSMLASNGRA